MLHTFGEEGLLIQSQVSGVFPPRTAMMSNKKFRAFHKTKVGILFFSGAGNTECLAQIFRGVFTRRGDCEVIFFERIKRGLDVRSLGEFDMLGVGFPIYFRETPSIVFETIEQLEGRNRKFFTFCTKGMYSGNVGREVQKRCTASNLHFVGNFEAFMPGTDILLLLAQKGSMLEKIITNMHTRHLTQKVSQFAETVLQAPYTPIPHPKWYTPLENRIVKPLERFVTRDYKVFKRGYHVLQERCTKCMLCVKDCPEGNIEFRDGTIVFGSRCDVCLRCIHHCPTEAIQIGKKTLKTVRYHPKVMEDLEIVIKRN